MKNLFYTISTIILASLLALPVNAQTPTPTPEEATTIISIPFDPEDVSLQGRNKGSKLSAEISINLEELPPTAVVVNASMDYVQTGISAGLMRVLDKRSVSIVDSVALGQEGSKSTSRVDSLIQDWIKNPENNLGFIFQTSELEPDAEVGLGGLKLTLEYSVPDKTNPEITKLELAVINQSAVRLTWETNEPVVVFAEYGKTSNYDRKTEKSVEYKDSDVLLIEDLSSDLTYHLQFNATDTSGNTTRSQNMIFTTNSGDISNQGSSSGLLAPRLLNSELRSSSGRHVVDLAWSASGSEDIMGYLVYRNLGDGPYSELSRLDKSVTRYSDTKAEPGALYNYYVVAYSGTEQSSKSPVITVEVPGSGVLGLNTMFQEGNHTLAVFFMVSGLLILFGIFYFFRKKIQSNIAYNEKLNRHQRLHNYLHDPEYYINGYEDAVIDKRSS